MNLITDSEAYYEVKADPGDNNRHSSTISTNENSKIKSLASFDHTYSLAVGTNKGNIRIIQIERMPGKS